MRSWEKRLITLLSVPVIFFTLLFLILFILNRTGYLRNLALAELKTLLPYQASLEDAWIDIWDPSLQVEDLKLYEEDRSQPLVQVPRLALLINLNPFRGSFFGIQRVRVESPRVELSHDFDPGGKTSEENGEKKGAAEPSAEPTHLPEIEVSGLQLKIALPGGNSLSLGEIFLSFYPVPEGGGSFGGEIRLPVTDPFPVSGLLDPAGNLRFLSSGNLKFQPARTTEAQAQDSLWRQLNLSGEMLFRLRLEPGPEGLGSIVAMDLRTKDLSATIPDSPLRLEGITGSVTFRSHTGVKAELQGSWQDTDIRVSASADWEGSPENPVIDGFLTAHNLPFDPQIRKLTDTDRDLREIWAAFNPEGRCDLVLSAKQDLGDAKPEFQARVRMRDTNLVFRGFPEPDGGRIGFPAPITELNGEVHYRKGFITLNHLRGKQAGGDFHLAGTLWGLGRVGIDLGVDCEKLALTPEFGTALASIPGIEEIWNSFQPRGSGSIHVRLQRDFGGRFIRPSGVFEALDTQARYTDFPLPVEGMQGKATFDPAAVQIDMRGKTGPGSFHASGAVARQAKGVANPFSLRFQMDGIPVDDHLRQALTTAVPETGEYWDLTNPSAGTLKGEVWVWRVPGSSAEDPSTVQTLAAVNATGLAAAYADLPVPVEEVQGLMVLERTGTGGMLVLDSLLGKAHGAPLLVNGRLEGETIGEKTNLQVRAAALPLSRELFLQARQGNLLGDTGLEELDWQGNADLDFQLRKNRDLVEVIETKAQLRDASLKIPGEDLRVRGIRGEVQYQAPDFTFQDLSLFLGQGFVRLTDGKGTLQTGENNLEVVAHLTRFPVGQDPATYLPAALAKKLEPLGLEGFVSAEGVRVAAAIGPEGARSIRFHQGVVRPENFQAGGELPLLIERAEIQIEEGNIEGESILARGTILEGKMDLFGRAIEKLNSRFEATDAFVSFTEARGNFYGGRMESGEGNEIFRMASEPPNPFKIDLHLADVDLHEFLKDLLPRSGALQGKLTIRLHMEGNREDRSSWIGEGEIQISDGVLWDIPVFSQILKLPGIRDLLGGNKQLPVFNEGRLVFTIQDQAFDIQDFFLGSTFVSVSSKKGTLRFDGALDMALKLEEITGGSPLDWILYPIVAWFVDIQASGSILNPVVTMGGYEGTSRRKDVYIPNLKYIPREFDF